MRSYTAQCILRTRCMTVTRLKISCEFLGATLQRAQYCELFLARVSVGTQCFIVKSPCERDSSNVLL